MPPSITADFIRQTREIIRDQIVTTPFLASRTLSEIAEMEVWVKFENLQFTASFKDRGAAAKLQTLTVKQRKLGVVAMSAGNHAQGVALHAGRLGIPATIVMPKTAPYTKVIQTEALGATVIQAGDSVSDGQAFADELQSRDGLTFVHPFDDPYVVAGQGSVALEMLEQTQGSDTVIVPIGGGGLISGISIALHDVDPSIEVLGVQSEQFNAVARVMDGQVNELPHGHTLADGIAVKRPGALTTPIIKEHVSKVLTVDESAIERAINLYLEVEKTVAEGAGAASLAALLQHRDEFKGDRVALILSGGNIDPRLLASVITRGLVHSGRLTRLRIEADDVPGSLALVTSVISEAGANIVDVNHQRLLPELAVRRVDIDVLVETRGSHHTSQLIELLEHNTLKVSIRSE
ncbi:MAG: threonine ammonia-lyase [Acidimicrobiales bacterium]